MQSTSKLVSLVAALSVLSGCATIQRHPYATAVVVGLVAGSVAASLDRDHAAQRCSTWGCQGLSATPVPRPLH